MEVGCQGGPLSVSTVVASSRRGPGREEWRDLSSKKVQFASDFLHFKAHLRNGSRSPRGPVISLDGRRIVASSRRRVADLVEWSGATCLSKKRNLLAISCILRIT